MKSKIQERNLSPQEIATQEKILKDLKQNKSQFVKRYGPDAEKIMFGIATKRAKQQSENMNKEKIREAVREALGAPKIKEGFQGDGDEQNDGQSGFRGNWEKPSKYKNPSRILAIMFTKEAGPNANYDIDYIPWLESKVLSVINNQK